jgi:hypothetical protein
LNDFRIFLDLLNETLAATIVTVATSMLLYNLSRNLRNRVARTSGIVLACVTIAYIGDVLISLEPDSEIRNSMLRLQWVGLAFIPVATFHLSDALLATTGLLSRGRRRRVVRILYAIAASFLIMAVFSDVIVWTEFHDGKASSRAGVIFWLYLAYFIPTNVAAFANILRARQRCLTGKTKRRMTYLLFAMLSPSIGIFPYSVLLSLGEANSVSALILVNLANLVVVFMLLSLAYPLSFFGSHKPDRVVKADLLRMMLRGPTTGLLALVVIIYLGPTTELFGLSGDAFMPFAVVMVILTWQWTVELALPWLEKWLIYRDEDDNQLAKINQLSRRLLTRTDMLQLLEAVLEATCDYLQIDKAFVATLTDQTAEFIKSVGNVQLATNTIPDDINLLIETFNTSELSKIHRWGDYWVIPLFSKRIGQMPDPVSLIGMMGVEAHSAEIDLPPEEQEMLWTFVLRMARSLDDMLLQTEVYAALEGLLPQISTTRRHAADVEYRQGYDAIAQLSNLPDREIIVEQVHAALRHYWGGPGLSQSRLLELLIVQDALVENENNPVRTLRSILLTAIENQRPNGERDMKSQEWTLYNILHLRFIENRKVRDTAHRLYMSQANLYRKQSIAIEAIADTLIEMEMNTLSASVEL